MVASISMLHVGIGLAAVAVGAGFVWVGLDRLKKPRRADDIAWQQRYPKRAAWLGGGMKPLPFDRTGAVAYAAAGVFLIFAGLGLVLS